LNSSGRSSKGSSGRARWSLPADSSLSDGLTLSERYAQRLQARGKTSEEILVETISAQRKQKLLEKQKMKNFYAKLSGKLLKASTLKPNTNRQAAT